MRLDQVVDELGAHEDQSTARHHARAAGQRARVERRSALLAQDHPEAVDGRTIADAPLHRREAIGVGVLDARLDDRLQPRLDDVERL
eukprot:3513289-Prymnesium_polylepis.1